MQVRFDINRRSTQHKRRSYVEISLTALLLLGGTTVGAGCGGSGSTSRAEPTSATATPTAPVDPASPQENTLARLIQGDMRQKRRVWRRNAILARVARARAEDFARRGYFDAINPDGLSANALVRQAGYKLPANYSTDPTANEVESIGAASSDPQEVLKALLDQRNTRLHLLGETPFYAAQTEYGIGYYHDDSSTYKDYWVVITAAPPSS